MVVSLLNAISKELHNTFGDSYHYYVEDVEQDIKKPCFTIDMIQPLMRSKGKIRYDRTMPVVVHYFSDQKTNLKKDCYAIAEQAIDSLEYLPFKKTLLRGEDLSWQLVDDVLQMFITYKFETVQADNVEDAMDEFESHMRVGSNE